MGLTNKQQAFIEHYLTCWNASEAARVAKYAKPGSQGHRLLKNVEIQREIERRLDELVMSADEVLTRLSEQARGVGSEYITECGTLDIAKMKDDGKMHLIKSVRHTKNSVIYELYDAQSALVHVGRHHILFTDRKETRISIDDVLAALPADFREAVRAELAKAIQD